MIEKLRVIWAIVRSRAFLVLTDKRAVMKIPILDPEDYESKAVLTAQAAALIEFNRNLEDLISEHENATRLGAYRQRVQGEKKRNNRKTPVQPSTKSRNIK